MASLPIKEPLPRLGSLFFPASLRVVPNPIPMLASLSLLVRKPDPSYGLSSNENASFITTTGRDTGQDANSSIGSAIESTPYWIGTERDDGCDATTVHCPPIDPGDGTRNNNLGAFIFKTLPVMEGFFRNPYVFPEAIK